MAHYSVAEFHGAVTHFPVAMLIASALFEVGAALFRKPEWRVVSFWLLVTGVAGAIPSLVSGWITGNEFFANASNPPDIYLRHRLWAFVTSGVALLLLVWRSGVKDKLHGAALRLSMALALVIAGGVGYVGYLGGEMTMGGADAPQSTPDVSTSSAPAVGGKIDGKLVEAGAFVYTANNCSSCHRIDGRGGVSGPDLSHEGSKNHNIAWQIAHLKNPSKVHPGSFMPSYDALSATDLNALANYLVSLK